MSTFKNVSALPCLLHSPHLPYHPSCNLVNAYFLPPSLPPSLSLIVLWPCSLDDEFGSQISLWSSEEGGFFQQQLEQMDFEREESKAKYEELKV